MAGAPARHNRISGNVYLAIGLRLRGRKCQPFGSDMLVRVRFPSHTRFYYPDVQVVCDPAPPEQVYQDQPVVIVEVVSESTRRTDEQEKREAFLSIPSLSVYVLLEQTWPLAIVWRRHSSGFTREIWRGLEATIPLPKIEAELPLKEVYEAVVFAAEAEPERG